MRARIDSQCEHTGLMRGALAGAALGLAGWLGFQLILRHGRLLLRIEALEAQLAELAAGAAPEAPALPTARSAFASRPSTSQVVYQTMRLKNGVSFQIAFDPRLIDTISEDVARARPSVFDDFDLLFDLMRPGDVVLDLGGHIGTFALAAAALGCQVVCVEAAPENVALLNASVARNGFDNLTVVHAAATDFEGTLQFLPHGPWGTIANASVLASPSMIGAGQLTPLDVPAVTVAGLLQRLGWERVDFIKMDIEGSEVAALHGMAQLLRRPDAPLIVFESNPYALRFNGQTRASLTATLNDLGYTTYVLEPDRVIPLRPNDLWVECVLNCLAVKGELPAFIGRPIDPPKSADELIQTIGAQCESRWRHERVYLARVLAEAGASLLADPRVRIALTRLRNDPEEEVRAAAAWFSP